MRVLQIIPELETGGAERTTVDIARALIDAGDEAIVASQGGRMREELPADADHIWMPVASKNPLTLIANAFRIQAVCRRKNIDVIHARSRAPAWSALWAARASNVPFVTTYHGAYKDSNSVKRWYNSVMARGDVVIANSHYTAERIRQQFRINETRLVVIPRGTDLSRMADPIEPYVWPVPDDCQVIVQIARLTEWKGQSVAINALANLPETVHLVLAGDDQGRSDYTAHLKGLADRAEVAHRVHFVGHVDPAKALAGADVCVVPSIRAEAFGRAAVEAQAAGVPVVVSALGAVCETVLAPPYVDEAHRTGWQVKAGDPMALAQGVRHALALEGDRRREHIGRARDHVFAHYSLEAMQNATRAVYRRLVPPNTI